MVLGLREIALTKTKRPFCANKRKKGETKSKGYAAAVSSIRTITVGFGIAPNQHFAPNAKVVAGCAAFGLLTAGGELRPALKQTSYLVLYSEWEHLQYEFFVAYGFLAKTMV